MVSCNIISGNHIMPLIGVYLTPSTLDHLPYLEESLNCFLVRDPVVLGDLNTNIGHLRNPRDQQVSVFLAYFGLVDLLGHFRQRLHHFQLQTWWQFLQGIVVHSFCGYVLGSYLCLFETLVVWEPRNFTSCRFSLCAWLLRQPTHCHGGTCKDAVTYP